MLGAELAALVLLFHPGPEGTSWGQVQRTERGKVLWQVRVPNIKLTAIANDLGLFYQGCQPGNLHTCEVDWFDLSTGRLLGIYNGDVLTYGKTFTVISDHRFQGHQDTEFIDSVALTTSGKLRYVGTLFFSEKCPQPSHFGFSFEYPELVVKATTVCGVRADRFWPTKS